MRYAIEYNQNGKKQYDGKDHTAKVDNIQNAYLWSDKRWADMFNRSDSYSEKGTVIPVLVMTQEELNHMEVTIARQLLTLTQLNHEGQNLPGVAETSLKVMDIVREVFKEKHLILNLESLALSSLS